MNDTYMDLNGNVYEGDEVWYRQDIDEQGDYEWVDSEGMRTRTEEDFYRFYCDTFMFDGTNVFGMFPDVMMDMQNEEDYSYD